MSEEYFSCVPVLLGGANVVLRPTKLVCLLRSYAAHAAEMKGVVPEAPTFFLKPPSSLLPASSGLPIVIPPDVKELHHEVELAVIIGKRAKRVPEADAMQYVRGFLLALDMTARDVQDVAKASRLPWARAKGYDTFAPIGAVGKTVSEFGDPLNPGHRIWLSVDRAIKQESTTSLMLYSIPRIVSEISNCMTLAPDDLILTGTPSGIGPVRPGQTIEAGIDGLCEMSIRVMSSS